MKKKSKKTVAAMNGINAKGIHGMARWRIRNFHTQCGNFVSGIGLFCKSKKMNLKIIGTSHIAKQSVNEIKKAIIDDNPDVVAIELDIERAAALLQEGKTKLTLASIMQIGVKGYIFAKVGHYIQQKLGKKVGVSPGSEMKAALELARKEKKDVAFIDQPIRITLKNFSKGLSWKERGRFFLDIFKGLLFPKKQMKQLGLDKFDLTKVPDAKVIEKMIG